MSMHTVPLTCLEHEGLAKHGLPIAKPSQLSDAFRLGVAWALAKSYDTKRYRKLQGWMGSNVKEGWSTVEQLGAVAAWEGFDAMDEFLDSLGECNVVLCEKASTRREVSDVARV